MDIVIEGNDASKYIYETSKIRWTALIRLQYIGAFIFFLLGVLIFIMGAYSDYTTAVFTRKYNNNLITEYNTKYDYHVSIGLGIGFMLIAVYFVFIVQRQKGKFFVGISNKCARHKRFSDSFTITINNELVCYRDFELLLEQKWSMFSHYKIYKQDLLLFQDNLYMSSMVIQKARLSEKDYSDLLDFLKSKLTVKKW